MSLDVSLRRRGKALYDGNITHNLSDMADAAELYGVLWEPSDTGITTARDLIVPLTAGLNRLESSPEYFRAYNAPNGWGTYESLVEFVREYLRAARRYPDARVEVWR